MVVPIFSPKVSFSAALSCY